MVMANLFDYLKWRGDLTFSQVPPGPVDALIFSALAYIRYGGIVEEKPEVPVRLLEASERFFFQEDAQDRVRVKDDMSLLMAAAETRRFGNAQLYLYRDILEPELETQFAAVTFLLDDGSAFIAFRGTDYTLVGWKEDFNMSFQDAIPAQQLALSYTREVAGKILMPLRLCGHSKGGNLAVFAAVKAEAAIRQRILGVYNNDGPGFREYLLEDDAYRDMVPRLHTYVPQSSVIGMLLEHEEPYIIIKSKTVGLLQHEFYSWELDGPDFAPMEEISAHSQFLNLTVKNWLADMSPEERNDFVDVLFKLLGTGNVESVKELIQPKNIKNYLQVLITDEKLRKMLTTEFFSLMEAAWRTQMQINDQGQNRLESPQ